MKGVMDMKIKKIDKKEEENIHREINQTIEGWPDWKRKAYDENFAISKYAKKYSSGKK